MILVKLVKLKLNVKVVTGADLLGQSLPKKTKQPLSGKIQVTMCQAPVKNLSKLTTQYTKYVNKIIEPILTFWHFSFQNTKPLRCYTGMFWTPSNKDYNQSTKTCQNNEYKYSLQQLNIYKNVCLLQFTIHFHFIVTSLL